MDGPFRVGLPFSIPLEFRDKYGNPTKPTSDLHPNLIAPFVLFLPFVSCAVKPVIFFTLSLIVYRGLTLDCGSIICKGSALYIQDIIAEGTVDSNSGKNFGLTVTIPELHPTESTQNLKIRLLPGKFHKFRT